MEEHYGKTDLNRNHEGSRGQTSPDDGSLMKNMWLLNSNSGKKKSEYSGVDVCDTVIHTIHLFGLSHLFLTQDS